MMSSTEESRRDRVRLQNFNRFRAYREDRKEYNPDFYHRLPLLGRPPAIYNPLTPQRAGAFGPTSRDMFDIDAYNDERAVPESFKVAWRRAQTLKQHFAAAYPDLKYNRCLGWGGNGMAAVFDDLNAYGAKLRSVVVKMLFSDETRVMQNETSKPNQLATDKRAQDYLKSEHILQIIYEEVRGLDIDPMDENEDEGGGPHGRKRRAEQSAHNRRPGKRQAIGRPKLNCFVTEMLENGDLARFIGNVRLHNEKIPNGILWRFLACFLRMCIGLAYPPSWIPELRNLPPPITEVVPLDQSRPPRRLVHFDFDPKNIFIGNIGQGEEHNLTPLLKLGDFGLATDVRGGQENFYYERIRHYAKRGYYAPEQFCVDWDYLEPNNGLVHQHPIAGNYDVHTNMWAVGLVMECLITLCHPANPPRPSLAMFPPPSTGSFYTYAGHLFLDEQYAHVDRELVSFVLRCQAHVPAYRPKLEELDIHQMLMNKGNCGQSDQELMQWMQRMLYDAPPGLSHHAFPPGYFPQRPQNQPPAGNAEPPPPREIIGIPPLDPVPDFHFRPMGSQVEGAPQGLRGPGHQDGPPQPGQPGPPGPFGQPGQPGAAPAPFGQVGQPGPPAPFGQLGQPGQPGATPAPFGQPGQFGRPGRPRARPAPFGQRGQPGPPGPFGAPRPGGRLRKHLPFFRR